MERIELKTSPAKHLVTNLLCTTELIEIITSSLRTYSIEFVKEENLICSTTMERSKMQKAK